MVNSSNSEHQAASLEHRRDDEPPAAVARLGWRYHHLGMPTDIPRIDEKYIPPSSPSDGVCSAMIVHNGAPVELISFDKKFKRKPSSRPVR